MKPSPKQKVRKVKAYKVRLYPNKQQEQVLLQTLGACRYVYNYFLSARKSYHAEYGKTLSYMQMSRDLTQMRHAMWLSDTQAEPLGQSLRRLDKSFAKFFREKRGFPKFKSKRDARQSFQKHQAWSVSDTHITIQSGLQIKYRGRINVTEKLGTLTILYSAGRWYASMSAIILVRAPKRYTKPIGIDVGLTTLATLSNGKEFANIRPARTNHTKLARASRILSRRQKGSNRYAKARLALARTHERIANIRRNHLHQISSAITSKNHRLIAVEDLNVRGMVKNRRLARSISDAGWSELVRQLEYKQAWKGGQLVKVDRFFPSSKLCSACGFLAETLPLNVRKWKCGGCGRTHLRDVNAAKNILAEALPYRVRGATVRPSRQVAVKRG